jgi:hypothetical protein
MMTEQHRSCFIDIIPAILCALMLLPMMDLQSSEIKLLKIPKDHLIEDVQQLIEFIETVHPDPYFNGGGKIAFHKLYQDIIASIPEQGISREEFYLLVRPLVAFVGDSHTWLRDPFQTDFSSPGGIPLYFGVVENTLFVLAVTSEEHKKLIGCRLISVQGIDLKEIVVRQNKVMGADNEFLLLRNLAGTGVLWQKPFLEALIPEWKNKNKISLELQTPDGDIREHVFNIPVSVEYPLISLGSTYKGPSHEKCDIAYTFTDDKKQTVILSITGMNSYREAFEMWNNRGHDIRDDAKDVYERFHGADPPEELDSIIQGLPSATEIFKELVTEMKNAQTKNLVIDVRHNEGGNSAMCEILMYFLYGTNTLFNIKMKRFEVEKYSRYYFETNPLIPLDQINSGRDAKLRVNDYDFDGLLLDEESIVKTFEDMVNEMPTFKNEVATGLYEGYYCPDSVYVVSSENTFSSGYTLMYYVYSAGAALVGTPSSQSGNCFGDVLGFELTHSKLTGIVSHKKFTYFPDDDEKGRVLKPHYILTYDRLRTYDFDYNAEIVYAIDLTMDEN